MITGLRDPEEPVDARMVGVWRLTMLIPAAVLTALLIVAALVVPRMDAPTGLRVALWVAAGVVAATGAMLAATLPGLWFRCTRWAVTDEGVMVRTGWLMRRLTLVPHTRIQAVDATSGPLERRVGLASVHVRTASPHGSPRIPGLDRDRARELAHGIAERAGTEDAV